MFGLRPDGKKVKDLDPIQRIIPHIMEERHDSQNLTSYDCPCEPMDRFIDEQSLQGMTFNYMHLLIAAMVRTFAHYPRLNRFVMNGRIFHRNELLVSFVVKKNLSADAPDSLVKLKFTGLESLPEVSRKIDEAIEANNRIDANNGTDKIARVLTITPNFLIKFLLKSIKFLDRHGMLPKAIIDLSPFHTSLFVTNMRSIRGPAIYHHLYDFGTTGIFMSMGRESVAPSFGKGNEVVTAKRMPVWITTDERFCDGFYFVSAMRFMERLLKKPELMLEPLDALVEDVEVIHGRKAREVAKQQKDLETLRA